MKNIMEAFPGKYLKAADVEEPKLYTMSDVNIELMQDGKKKPVLSVQEDERKIVLSKERATDIAKVYGYSDDKWPGKKIVAFSGKSDFSGQTCIRFRKPKGVVVETENPADGMNDDIPF